MLLDQATVDYGTYVDDQITFLLVPVQELAAAIKAGDLAAAQAAYIKARPFYERIEPVAESFPDLDPAIDLRVGDVEAGTTWTGFHPIEQALFEKQTTEGLSELADQLVVDVQTLQAEAAKLSAATAAGTAGGYQAFEIANGSATLLDEVLASKITGEEEAYSKIDLLDFEANVEGSLQAFATLKPALDQIDPTLVPQIAAAFDALDGGAGQVPGSDVGQRLGVVRQADRGGQEGADRRVAGGPGAAVGHLGEDHELGSADKGWAWLSKARRGGGSSAEPPLPALGWPPVSASRPATASGRRTTIPATHRRRRCPRLTRRPPGRWPPCRSTAPGRRASPPPSRNG